MNTDEALRQHLVKLLKSGEAHATFEDAIAGLPAELRGKRPEGVEYSPWQLLEHLRIAQEDILDFSRNPNYKSLKWPDEYWPTDPAPANDKAWEESVQSFRRDLDAMCELVSDEKTDLFVRIPHGDGQTILREALLTADHNAYHVGQLVLLRKLLGAWK
jgi:uncharacterized damage-inducible protein DinB